MVYLGRHIRLSQNVVPERNPAGVNRIVIIIYFFMNSNGEKNKNLVLKIGEMYNQKQRLITFILMLPFWSSAVLPLVQWIFKDHLQSNG